MDTSKLTPLQKAIHMKAHLDTYPNESIAFMLVGVLVSYLILGIIYLIFSIFKVVVGSG